MLKAESSLHGVANQRVVLHHSYSLRLKVIHFAFSIPFTLGNDCSRMTHAFFLWGSLPTDKSDYWLFEPVVNDPV